MPLLYEFIVPDAMFSNEFLDLGDYESGQLLAGGLAVSVLSGEAVALTIEYGAIFKKTLRTNDRFALEEDEFVRLSRGAEEQDYPNSRLSESLKRSVVSGLCCR